MWHTREKRKRDREKLTEMVVDNAKWCFSSLYLWDKHTRRGRKKKNMIQNVCVSVSVSAYGVEVVCAALLYLQAENNKRKKGGHACNTSASLWKSLTESRSASLSPLSSLFLSFAVTAFFFLVRQYQSGFLLHVNVDIKHTHTYIGVVLLLNRPFLCLTLLRLLHYTALFFFFLSAKQGRLHKNQERSSITGHRHTDSDEQAHVASCHSATFISIEKTEAINQ